MRRGIFLDGKRAQLTHVQPIGPTRLRVVLQQGLNRQIRRMFYELGYEVKRLVRTRLGHLRLGDLPRGNWRPLTKSELALVPLSGNRSFTPIAGAIVGCITPAPRAKSRRAACSRRRNSSSKPIATVNALTINPRSNHRQDRRRVGQLESENRQRPTRDEREHDAGRTREQTEKQIFRAENFPDLPARGA